MECEEPGVAYSFLHALTPELKYTTNIHLADFISNTAKEEKDPEIINFLLASRKYLSFLDSNLEETYIHSGFTNVPKCFSLRLTTLYDDQVSDEFKEYIKSKYGMNHATGAANRVHELLDKEMNNDNYKEIIVYTNLLKTCLLYLDESSREIQYSRLTESNNELYVSLINHLFDSNDETLDIVNQDINGIGLK